MLCPAPVPSRDPPRSLTMTLAPSLARLRAYSRPSPPPAPVTTMTRSCTPGMRFLSRTLEQPSSELPSLLCIRGIDDGRNVGSGWLGHHRLAVAELLEP